jgi:hypothetical protein
MLNSRTTHFLRRLALHAHFPTRRILPSSAVSGIARMRLFSGPPEGANSDSFDKQQLELDSSLDNDSVSSVAFHGR